MAQYRQAQAPCLLKANLREPARTALTSDMTHLPHLSAYEPPVDETQLLLKWIRRARESQMSHYDMADLLSARDRLVGWLVTALTALVGTAVFASLTVTAVSVEVRVVVGLVSVAAAVGAALQTYLRYAERAEKHRAAGARYGAVRRRLEAIFAGDADARDGHYLTAIRDELDRLAEDSPNVPPRIFYRTQRALSADTVRSRNA
jgi:hypothetical protein